MAFVVGAEDEEGCIDATGAGEVIRTSLAVRKSVRAEVAKIVAAEPGVRGALEAGGCTGASNAVGVGGGAKTVAS